MMIRITERYADKILGTLSCFDRVVITGTLPELCHSRAMPATLRAEGFRLFDYARFAEPLRGEIRTADERLATENGLQIEYIRRNNFRK